MCVCQYYLIQAETDIDVFSLLKSTLQYYMPLSDTRVMHATFNQIEHPFQDSLLGFITKHFPYSNIFIEMRGYKLAKALDYQVPTLRYCGPSIKNLSVFPPQRKLRKL